MSFCPHCHSGHDPVLVQSTWSCGVRYNDPSWRTKECYKRNLELANERIKRLEEAGDPLCAAAAFMGWHLEIEKWNKAKEAKP